MATVSVEATIDVPARRVWEAVADIGAVHQRLLPCRVADTRIEGDVRPNQVVLAWLMASDPSWLPVIGVNSVAQLDECLGATDLAIAGDVLTRLNEA